MALLSTAEAQCTRDAFRDLQSDISEVASLWVASGPDRGRRLAYKMRTVPANPRRVAAAHRPPLHPHRDVVDLVSIRVPPTARRAWAAHSIIGTPLSDHVSLDASTPEVSGNISMSYRAAAADPQCFDVCVQTTESASVVGDAASTTTGMLSSDVEVEGESSLLLRLSDRLPPSELCHDLLTFRPFLWRCDAPPWDGTDGPVGRYWHMPTLSEPRWSTARACTDMRGVVLDQLTRLKLEVAQLAALTGIVSTQLNDWIAGDDSQLDRASMLTLLRWLITVGACDVYALKDGEEILPPRMWLDGGFRSMRACMAKMWSIKWLARCPWRCASCGRVPRACTVAARPRPSHEHIHIGSEHSEGGASSVSEVSSWDLLDIPDADVPEETSGGDGQWLSSDRCISCESRRRTPHARPAFDGAPFLRAADACLRHDVRVLHAIRAATTTITGSRSYVRHDGFHDKAFTSPTPVAPGHSHPYLLQRIRTICLLDASDLVIDVGSGDGFAAVGLAALSGCRVFGVEIVPSRAANGSQLVQAACPRVTTLRKRVVSCRCVGGEAACEHPAGHGALSLTGLLPHSKAEQKYVRDMRSALEGGGFRYNLPGLRYSHAPAHEFAMTARVAAVLPRVHPTPDVKDQLDDCIADADVERAITTLCESVQFVVGDARDVLRATDSPLSKARVVFCNNYGGKWHSHDFQMQIFRLLSRLVSKGTILVSCTQFTGGTRKASSALIDEVKAAGYNSDAFTASTLYFEVSGGWIGPPDRGVMVTDDSRPDTPETPRHKAAVDSMDGECVVPMRLLRTPQFDAECDDVWKRGMQSETYEYIRRAIERRAMAQIKKRHK